MRLVQLGCLLLLLPLSSACSSDEGTDPSNGNGPGINHPECAGAIEFLVGVERTSAAGLKVTIVESAPATPQVGDNKSVVRIVDASGTPVEGATVVVKSKMPAHGHASPRTAQITPLGDGKYELNPVNFNMDKLWETTIEVFPAAAAAGSEPDSVIFPFCVSG